MYMFCAYVHVVFHIFSEVADLSTMSLTACDNLAHDN